nr:putative dsRNA-binding protein [Candidatus Sigynarchaeum springense]
MNLQGFFHLETKSELFAQAIMPLSCGGDDSFKNLAFTGDNFIDKALQTHFNLHGIQNSGDLTKKINEFHNERTLERIGKHLEITNYLIPIDQNYHPSTPDIKETIESLIGASLQANGDEIVREIVVKLYKMAETNCLLDADYISLLNQTLQKEGIYSKPPFQDEFLGGSSHQPLWMTRLDLTYQGQDYHVESGVFRSKTDSKRDAARRVLIQIYALPEDSPPSNTLPTLVSTQTKPIRAMQSLDAREIVFTKSESDKSETESMQSSTNTGERILDWAMRKAKKNPFGMLLLLSGKIPKVSGSAWYASTPEGELTLLNVKLDDKSYFEVGIGQSASKSRKDAAEKMITNSELYTWLNQHYSDKLV